MKRVLFLTSRLPFPPIGGDKLRTFNFIKCLKRNHHLTLLSFIEHESELDCIQEYNDYFDEIKTVTLSPKSSYFKSFLGLFSPEPLQIHYYKSEKMQALVAEELAAGFDAVFCHLIRMAQYLPDNDDINKVVDFTDAISLNYSRSKQYRTGMFSLINNIEAKRVYKYELDIIDRANTSIFISPIDAEFLKNDKNHHKVKVVANGVDFEKFPFYNRGYDRNQIVFVGNMRTFPNTDAVLYFANDVLPLLEKESPDVRFYIVGNEPNKKVLALHDGKKIFVTGFVDSTIPYVTNSAALIAPMRVGAGVQNKILEAMSLGTPVVTTSIGAEGLEKKQLTVADSPEKIAEKLLELMVNETKREAKAVSGRAYIEKSFCWENVLKNLDTYI